MWNFITANCTGSSHLKKGEDGQDRFSTHTTRNNCWYAACVCDGAGSSKNGGLSAEITSVFFAKKLISIADKIDAKEKINITDEVSKIIIKVRESLREKSQSSDLKDWHCTLMAALIDKDGNGFVVHIGDGVIFSANYNSESLNISYVSEPENGEYANETFFMTGKDWNRHLRINIINQANFVALATDGAASLFWDEKTKKESNKGIHLRFWNPVWREIMTKPNNILSCNEYLTGIINNELAQKSSDDDKTIVILFDDHQKMTSDNISGNTQRLTHPTKFENQTTKSYLKDGKSPEIRTDTSLNKKTTASPYKLDKIDLSNHENTSSRDYSYVLLIFILLLILLLGFIIFEELQNDSNQTALDRVNHKKVLQTTEPHYIEGQKNDFPSNAK